jgi:hypothetical protein
MLPVGYFSPTQDPPNVKKTAVLIDEIMEQAVLAESVGYDGFFFPEHHQQADAFLPNPVLLAGLVGMRTKRIKVGPSVLLAPLYHPIRLAEDVAMIDLATKGRFVCALGVGYVPRFRRLIPFKQRGQRTRMHRDPPARPTAAVQLSEQYYHSKTSASRRCRIPRPARRSGRLAGRGRESSARAWPIGPPDQCSRCR